MTNILDPKFRYTPAAKTNLKKTNLKKTFARIRREQAKQDEQETANKLERISKVRVVFKGR